MVIQAIQGHVFWGHWKDNKLLNNTICWPHVLRCRRRSVRKPRILSATNQMVAPGNDVNDLLYDLKSQITRIWVPSHIGIPGNQTSKQIVWPTLVPSDKTSTLIWVSNFKKPSVEPEITSVDCGSRNRTTQTRPSMTE